MPECRNNHGMHRCYMHRFFRCSCFLQNSSNSTFLWVLSSCIIFHGLFTSSLGSRNIHLTKPLVPFIVLSYDHQNHLKWHKWCHVRYNLLLFGDWWQHNQNKYKICKKWQIEPLTLAWMFITIQWWLGLPLRPWFPSLFLPLFATPLSYVDLIHSAFLPLWDILLLLEKIPCFDPHFSPFGIKSPKRSCS